MSARAIKDGAYWIGVNDRTKDLFEGLWPIRDVGISYNSYFIDDEQKAIIDLTSSGKEQEFLSQLSDVGDISEVDYLVVNHMEPDHSGGLKTIRNLAPDLTLLGSKKTVEMLESFFGITENIRAVEDGETLQLGETELKFLSTPFVHWPETIMSYDVGRRILFSGDGFGTFGTLDGAVFDDEIQDLESYRTEGLRYFANVIASFSRMVLKALDRVGELEVDAVAPSHGPVWREDLEHILDLYERWSGYAEGPAEAGVTLIYGSMYGNTERMMNVVAEGIAEEGLEVEVFDAARHHASYILSGIWERQGVLIGAPTYEGQLFPPVAEVLRTAALKHMRGRTAGWFGSCGWGGGARKSTRELAEELDWEMVDDLEFTGQPTAEDLEEGRELGRRFAEAVSQAARQRQTEDIQ